MEVFLLKCISFYEIEMCFNTLSVNYELVHVIIEIFEYLNDTQRVEYVFGDWRDLNERAPLYVSTRDHV